MSMRSVFLLLARGRNWPAGRVNPLCTDIRATVTTTSDTAPDEPEVACDEMEEWDENTLCTDAIYSSPHFYRTFDWNVTKGDIDRQRGPGDALQGSALAIDHRAPNFSADAVVDGEITQVEAADYVGKWVILFFYPKDFTFVCPTEIIAFSDRAKEFRSRGCELVAASTDSAEVHLAWIRTPRRQGGLGRMQIPILADVDRRVSRAYGVLNRDGFCNRGIFLIDPEGRLKSLQILQNDVGRSVEEALRLLDAFQYVAQHGVVCPADWKPGGKAMQADPDGSLEYFGEAEASREDDAVFGETLAPVASREHYMQVTQSSSPVVVDFMAGWCGKCRMIAPHVESLQEAYPGITFYRFDTSDPELEGLSKELGVAALPAFKLFKHGQEVVPMVVGYKKKPLSEAVEKLSNM